MTTRWFCYVEGFPSERCLLLHHTRKEHRPHVKVYREHPYPIGHDRCGWVDVPEKADKRELAA